MAGTRVLFAAAVTILLLLPVAAVRATAASDTEDIAGSVHDHRNGFRVSSPRPPEVISLGTPVPDATVTLVNLETQDTVVTHTDDQGAFAFPATPAGRYRLEITKPGFEGARRFGLALKYPAPPVIGPGAKDDPTGARDLELKMLSLPPNRRPKTIVHVGEQVADVLVAPPEGTLYPGH